MSDELAPEIAALLENAEADLAADEEIEQSHEEDLVVDPATLKPTAPWAPVNLLIKHFQPVERFFFPTRTRRRFLTMRLIIRSRCPAKKKALSACTRFCPNI